MRLWRTILRSLALASLLLFPAAPGRAADPFADAARQLAREIASRAGTGMPFTLNIRNLSSLSESQFSDARRTLESQLRAQGLRVAAPGQAGLETRITLAENAQGYLWVAEIRKDESPQVVMEPVARTPAAALPPAAALFALRKTLIWAQDEPILDLAVLDMGEGSSQLLVLEPAQVALYVVQGARGEVQQAQPIAHAGAWPRDLRGRLVLHRGHLLDAYLPGLHCNTPGQSLGALNCVASDDPWPLDSGVSAFFSPTHNFFTGILSGGPLAGKNTAPFFSAARIGDNESELWLFAGVDGRVRLARGTDENVADIPGWGSDLAGTRSGCGHGWQVLAARAGGDNAPDAVQAFETVGRQAVAVTMPAQFAGPITALWPAVGGGAVAVAHNLKTGQYEAFGLTVTCER